MTSPGYSVDPDPYGTVEAQPARAYIAPVPKPAFWQSLHVAFQGLLHVLRTERNARIEGVVGLAVVLAGLIFQISRIEWILLVVLICLVLALEMINTAIEATVDLAMPEWHALAKIAKDSAAGAVLLVTGGSVVVGVLIFGPRIWELLRRVEFFLN